MSLAGLQLGRYRLLRLVGSGGMGEVYLAEDKHLGRRVAIKLFRSEGPHSSGVDETKKAARLFRREMKAIAMLDHPHILPLFDYGEETVNGAALTYMVMSFRKEGSLALWLHQRTARSLTLVLADHFLQQAAGALQHAHDHQIIHRDVKPSNFLIRSKSENPEHPDLLLADFGIAKFNSAIPSESSAIRGTPTHMAPEQWKGQPVYATDQYALAVMVYELLTGNPPFKGGLEQVMYLHLNAQPDPPGALNPSIPAAIDAVILRALAKKPEDRFDSISAFAHSFQEVLPPADIPVTLSASKSGEVVQSISSPTIANTRSRQALLLTNSPTRPVSPKNTRTLIDNNVPAPRDTPLVTDLDKAALVPPGVDSNNKNKVSPATPEPALRGKVNKWWQGRSKVLVALLIGLLLLAAAEGVGLFYFARINHVNTTAGTGSTPIVNTHPTGLQNPYPPYGGRLVLNDPLFDNGKGYNWDVINGSCQFSVKGYLVREAQPGHFQYCTARATDFSNFACQVQITILNGDYGGLIFRANALTGQYYYFRLGQDGSYILIRYIDNLSSHAQILIDGTTSAVRTGLNHPNLVAVVAFGSTIALFVNRQYISTVHDSTYSHGQIAVVAEDEGNLTGVLFSDVMVWAL